MYGDYKAKIRLSILDRLKHRADGHYVVELESSDFVQYSVIIFTIFHLPLPVHYTSLGEVELCVYMYAVAAFNIIV